MTSNYLTNAIRNYSAPVVINNKSELRDALSIKANSFVNACEWIDLFSDVHVEKHPELMHGAENFLNFYGIPVPKAEPTEYFVHFTHIAVRNLEEDTLYCFDCNKSFNTEEDASAHVTEKAQEAVVEAAYRLNWRLDNYEVMVDLAVNKPASTRKFVRNN